MKKMKLLLVISVIASISAIKVPSSWNPNQNQNQNNVNRDSQPIRQPVAQAGPNYNNVNAFAPNPTSEGVIPNANVLSDFPEDINDWFNAPNNGFTFTNPANQIASGNVLNNINPIGNEIRRQPFVQPQINYNGRPTASGYAAAYNEVPGQIPYVTYTRRPPHQKVNAEQAYPNVATLNTGDLSPFDPFAQGQQNGQASTQINNQNAPFTPKPLNNLDFNPFSRNSQANTYQVTQYPQVPVNNQLVTSNRKPISHPTGSSRNVDFNPFTKNYRDHRTHEPTQYEPYYNRDPVPAVKRLESEKAPIVRNHEHLAEVPTRPIYPGEAQWSKPGVKHRPFVSKQQYSNLEESKKQPDGYDAFLDGLNLFENQNNQFGQKIQQFPSNLPTQPSNKEESTEDSEIFVPTRLYAQVRHSEDEEHLPPESDENGRLKELVKDTKIQTIYSEEGYEDSAYDHAGHEKKAENTEGFEAKKKDKEAKEKKRIPVKKYNRDSSSYSIGDQNLTEKEFQKLKEEELNLDNESEEEENDDSEPAGTHYDEQSYLSTALTPGVKNETNEDEKVKSKEIKTVTTKDKSGGNIEMEISSEVKAVPQPNNGTKFHKYVKIYPKINKNVTSNLNLLESENSTKESKIEAEKRSLNLAPQEIFIEEIINQTSSSVTEEYVSTTTAPTEYTEIVTMEIPTTTEATTAIPKLEVEDEGSPSSSQRPPLNLKLRKRRKRSVDGIPEIEIDTDFIDEINHDLGKPTEKPKAPIENKFPYYKAYKEKGLHENSPLRYSEDLKKVPVKTEGRLAFYDLADKRLACSDVNPEADPVPDRIKNADESVEEEEEDEEGNDPATKDPRLGKLGDKIDCFKQKYFGENPLDNPFFQEQVIGPVKPIFSEIESISSKKIGDNTSKGSDPKNTKSEPDAPVDSRNGNEMLHVAASNHEAENEIDDRAPYKYALRSWFPGKTSAIGENTERESKFINHFVEKNSNPKVNIDLDSRQSKGSTKESEKEEVPTLPSITLITTPKYTIQLKPKHIYDQIELLDYLPDDELDEVKKAINAELPKINLTDVTTSSPNANKTETVLNAPVIKKKKSQKKGAERRAKVLQNQEENMRMETTDNRKPEALSEVDVLELRRTKPRKPQYQIFDINKFIPKVPNIPQPTPRGTHPTYLAPVSIVNPTYQIFDINKYLPTTPFPLLKEFITQSTVLPKYKVLSEVFYKEQIKPNEQLNVFTDVLQHIKNFPKMKDSFSESSEPISVKLTTEKMSQKYPASIFEEIQAANKDYLSSTLTTLMTTFDPKVYASNHKYPQAESPMNAERQVEDMLNEFKTNNKPKSRRRLKTTTQETPVVIEESTSTLSIIGEPTEVMGLMPPIIQGYKTIYHPKRDNSQHISGPTIRIEERKINKYFVQGMRPPPKQKVYLYSDFLTDNHITQRMSKPKRNKLRRSRRSAQRPAYAQLSRNRNKQPEEEVETKKEEEDDYKPNRSRNYHYDEKTGKIVYDKKPQGQTEEEEDVEYIEVVEETPTPKTTEKPKQNPIFATATPPPAGQSYTDFVKLLKGASNYKEIPDPTTTEKGAEEVTQKMVASTLDPVSTTPPEFLSILAKVRDDSNYKLIEDKKEGKKKTTTTPEPEEEEEAESSDEESQVVRNSPGGQGYEAGSNLEIFDISDFLPNIKSYLPKTSIDTSKYKTIERPSLRHSLSSRYNSEDDKDLQNVNTSKQPILMKNEKAEEAANAKEATTAAPAVTTQKPIRSQRRRTTTASTITVEDEKASATQATTAAEESAPVHHDKARRTYRRRPTRIKIKSTADNGSDAETDASKVVRRRSERDSHMYADGNEKYQQVIDSDGAVSSPLIRAEEYVDYEIPDNLNITSAQKIDNIDAIAKKVVDVFKNYHKGQRHGGNYRDEDEVIKEEVTSEEQEKPKESVEEIRPQDKVKKPEKEDTAKSKEHIKHVVKKTDPKDIKKVEVFKDYDKTKKHGGNYRPANDEVTTSEQDESGLERNESIQIKNVNVFQDYDKTKKHGGNYKAADDFIEEQKADLKNEKPVLSKNVEVFKDYDKTKKHGGNYKPENDTVIPEQQLEESQYGTPQFRQNVLNDETDKKASVEVFKDYDKTKKHGGNYRRENETTDKEKPSESQRVADKAKDIEVFKDYDENKKTGGNYRREDDIEPTADETHYSKSNTPQEKRYTNNRNDIQRLADAALKPEFFYSDLKLPLDINALKVVKDLPSDELEEIVDGADTDTGDKDAKESATRIDEAIAVVDIGNRIKIAPVVEGPTATSTKKPLFIKDPSKRLYFYAPVR